MVRDGRRVRGSGSAGLRLAALSSLLVGIGALELRAGVPSLEGVSASPDVTIELSPTLPVADEDVSFTEGGTPMLSNLGALPAAADLAGYHLLQESGDQLFVLDVTVTLPGAVVARPSDVIRVASDGVYSLHSPALSAHVPAGTAIDALSVDEAGRTVVSFDTTVSLPGSGGAFAADDEDLVTYDPTENEFSLLLDGSAVGIPPAADLDAAHLLPNGDRMLVSFDVSGVVGTVTFDDEDVLLYEPGAGFSLHFALSEHDADWLAADLDAFHTADSDLDGTPDPDDGCPLNPQLAEGSDVGGVATPANPQANIPDGILDACQCGDVTDDGKVNGNDATLITFACINFQGAFPNGCSQHQDDPLFVFEKCDVGANPVSGPQCNGNDATVITFASLGLAPGGVSNVCPAYAP